MNKFKKTFTLVVISALVLLLAFSLVACNDTEDEVKISIANSVTTITKGETVKLTVNVSGNEDKTYAWSVSDDTVLKVEDDTVSVIADLTEDKTVTVTATSNADKTKSASVTFTVKAPATSVQISIADSVKKITKGETVTLTVNVTGADDATYTWSVSPVGILKVENDTVSVVADITIDTLVTVTATATADSNAKDSVTFTVKAPFVDGQVGDLTSAMIEEAGNASIRVEGVVADIYQDLRDGSNNKRNEYDSLVLMEEGEWNGSWHIKDNDYNVITNSYKKGDETVKNSDGVTGHALKELYINKDNEVANKTITDYLSVPAVWEAQHLYNHIGQLNVNKFEYVPEADLYQYQLDAESEEDLYLMTYFAFSLTPMLDETFFDFYLKVENGAITQIIAQTQFLYYGDEEDPDALSYTLATLNISDFGTTEVSDPVAYEAPESADKLQAAINGMKNVKNYTFKTKDVTTSAPSSDDGDYSIDSAAASTAAEGEVSTVFNHTSSTGTVGVVGYVTENDILVAETGKYSYSLDDKLYHTEYYGYRQFDGFYEEFKYDSDKKVMAGTKRIEGAEMFDLMPGFDFSVNVFDFSGMNKDSNTGKKYYTFVLRNANITRSVAMEVSAFSNAENGDASVSSSLTIVVDEDGNLVSTMYPYSFTGYAGYCETTYSNVGTTTIQTGAFNGYVNRKIITSWSDTTTKYFTSTNSSLDSHEEDTATVLNYIFGDKASLMPSPALFTDVFGDNLFGPFFDFTKTGTDESGNPIYSYSLSINTETQNYDENGRIQDWDAIITKLTANLDTANYAVSQADSKTTDYDRYVTYFNSEAGIKIVVDNNYTKNIFITIEKL